jgi:hypothetical protein
MSDPLILPADVEEHLQDIVQKNLDFPQETKKTPLSGGRVGSGVAESVKSYGYSVYNPHNSRFFFNYTWVGSGRVGSGLVSQNSGSELRHDDFEGFRFVVKRKSIELTDRGAHERIFLIQGSSDERQAQVAAAKADMVAAASAALRKFVGRYGGRTDFVCFKALIFDNKIVHDKAIDAIPDAFTFRNDVVKKVYPYEHNVEFSTPEYASNYFRNSGLSDFAPEIAARLEALEQRFDNIGYLQVQSSALPVTLPAVKNYSSWDVGVWRSRFYIETGAR